MHQEDTMSVRSHCFSLMELIAYTHRTEAHDSDLRPEFGARYVKSTIPLVPSCKPVERAHVATHRRGSIT